MIAVVLAGGYATRLRALSRDLPKALLRVANKPIIDYVFDKLAELEDIHHTIVSTNLKFESDFRLWLESNPLRKAEIVADNSRSEEEKPGAVASLSQVTAGRSDDYLIIAGDNLFTSPLEPMLHAFRSRSYTVVALYDIKDRALARHYSTVTLDADGRITSLNEKPVRPETTLIGTCVYMIPERTLKTLREYVTEAVDRDSPGKYIGWLCRREPVYGHLLSGYWWDIGTIDQYREADSTLQSIAHM